MIIGIGTDIVEIARIEKLIANPRFLERVFSPAEIEAIKSHAHPAQWAAGRFAAKEAAAKALRTGIAGCPPDCVETLPGENGAPGITLHGKALSAMDSLGVSKLHVSISHEKEYAVATVVAES
jgi:holo-[acyl-carrier protein] synthase